MSVSVEDDPRSAAAAERRRWRAAAIAMSAVVVLMLGWAAWWVTHPDVLYPFGNAEGWTLDTGQTGAFDMAIAADRNQYGDPSQPVTISIHRIVPVITTNTADAEVTIVLCEGRKAGGVGTVAAADVSQYCATTTPVTDGSDFPYNYANGQQLIALITPRSPGVVVIEGFQVTYADGLRRGTQHSGVAIEVRGRAR